MSGPQSTASSSNSGVRLAGCASPVGTCYYLRLGQDERVRATNALDGCWAKLARADELTDALAGEIKTDREGGYLRFSLTSEDGIGIRVHVHRQPPFHRWVLVGEIVHDLRSALDHLTWALTVAHSGPPPRPLDGWWRGVEFPIFTDAALFHKQDTRGRPGHGSGLADLRGVDPVLLPVFESLQPFQRGARAERHPLAMLHALSIRDKHQTLPLVAIAGRAGTITAHSGNYRGRARSVRVAAPIPDSAVIARLRTLSGASAEDQFPKVGDRVTIRFEVGVDFEFGFAAGVPAFGGELITTLATFAERPRVSSGGLVTPAFSDARAAYVRSRRDQSRSTRRSGRRTRS